MLDGIEPGVVGEIRHAAEHVPGIDKVTDAKARWLGHRLYADVAIAVRRDMPLAAANEISAGLRHQLHTHIPALAVANVRFDTADASLAGLQDVRAHHHGHMAEPEKHHH